MLKASILKAPFSTSVETDDQIIVTIEFAPKFSLVDEKAGPKTAKATLSGSLWKSEVPLSGYFNGLRAGMMAVSVQPQTLYAVSVSGPTCGAKMTAWPQAQLSAVNVSGKPHLVQFGAGTNSVGLTVDAPSTSFAIGESRNVPLSVSWVNCKNPTGDQSVVMSFDGLTASSAFHMEYVPSWRSFSAGGTGWQATVTLTSSGEQRFSTQCFITGMQLAHDCSFYFYRNGQDSGARTVSHAAAFGGPANDTRSWTTATTLKPDEVWNRMQSAWHVVYIDGKGDPNSYPKIPLAPDK
ncbi:MAG TPA: hypothetical protein VGJ84_00350 [Polyangiaceae bacterium]